MGAQQNLESRVSPRYFMLCTTRISVLLMVIFGCARYCLLVKILAFHFSGDMEKKDEVIRFCSNSSELLRDAMERLTLDLSCRRT